MTWSGEDSVLPIMYGLADRVSKVSNKVHELGNLISIETFYKVLNKLSCRNSLNHRKIQSAFSRIHVVSSNGEGTSAMDAIVCRYSKPRTLGSP